MGQEFKDFGKLFEGTGIGEKLKGGLLGKGTSARAAPGAIVPVAPTQDELDLVAVEEARVKAKEALKGRRGRASTVSRGRGAGLLGGETTGSLLGD